MMSINLNVFYIWRIHLVKSLSLRKRPACNWIFDTRIQKLIFDSLLVLLNVLLFIRSSFFNNTLFIPETSDQVYSLVEKWDFSIIYSDFFQYLQPLFISAYNTRRTRSFLIVNTSI